MEDNTTGSSEEDSSISGPMIWGLACLGLAVALVTVLILLRSARRERERMREAVTV